MAFAVPWRVVCAVCYGGREGGGLGEQNMEQLRRFFVGQQAGRVGAFVN